jgi:hypothetical protein
MKRHFDEFCDIYDKKYAGMFRPDRIRATGERFLTCGECHVAEKRVHHLATRGHGARFLTFIHWERRPNRLARSREVGADAIR